MLPPEVFFPFPRSLLEQTGIIFGSDLSCQASCHLQFTRWHTRGSYWSLLPSEQLFWDVCTWHSQGLPADSLPSPEPIVPSPGGSAACFYAPNQRAASWISQSAVQTGLGSSCGLLSLTKATVGNEMLRDSENGNWGDSLFFLPFYFSSDIWIDWVKSWWSIPS